MSLAGLRKQAGVWLPRLAALAVLACLAGLLVVAPAEAAGSGPFGVGLPEAAVPTGGVFGWIAARQAEFYKALTSAIRLLRTDPAALWTLVGLSFAYGVAHAAGPGHGKAVISAYVIANRETLKRGIVLAFVSALAQGLTAALLIGAATKVLNLTSLAITDATRALELASGTAIAILGLYLLVRRLAAARRSAGPNVAACPSLASASVPAPGTTPKAGLRYKGEMVRPADLCADCGQMHMPAPDLIAGPFSWRKAFGAIAAVGLRPCTGALIVLTFTFSLGLWWAGLVAVAAMSLGTGLTVAVLATLAVTLRDTALKLSGPDSPWAARALGVAEIAGAAAILLLGVLILGATLVGVSSGG